MFEHIHPLSRLTKPTENIRNLVLTRVEDPETLAYIKNDYLTNMYRESNWFITMCDFLLGGCHRKRDGWKYFYKR